MRAERERGDERELGSSAAELHEAQENGETLTDLIDRMDREAFKRSLEQRDLRVQSSALERRR